jgi:hypothetical protein
MSKEPEQGERVNPFYPCSTVWHLVVAGGVKVRQVKGEAQLVIATAPKGQRIEATIPSAPAEHTLQISINSASATAAPAWVLRLAPKVKAYKVEGNPELYEIQGPKGLNMSIVALPEPPNRTTFLLSQNPPQPASGPYTATQLEDLPSLPPEH